MTATAVIGWVLVALAVALTVAVEWRIRAADASRGDRDNAQINQKKGRPQLAGNRAALTNTREDTQVLDMQFNPPSQLPAPPAWANHVWIDRLGGSYRLVEAPMATREGRILTVEAQACDLIELDGTVTRSGPDLEVAIRDADGDEAAVTWLSIAAATALRDTLNRLLAAAAEGGVQ
ncbi:hypothetical protein ABZ215_24620 [Amycolatopsis sp. NPDC006131]|uniref:hypothetical protein n=1 Tax=Amycolatopsis sp. NPDC006131 TaxID=3156731 RepID=UPI0033BD8FF8